jgi:hypothetical protein
MIVQSRVNSKSMACFIIMLKSRNIVYNYMLIYNDLPRIQISMRYRLKCHIFSAKMELCNLFQKELANAISGEENLCTRGTKEYWMKLLNQNAGRKLLNCAMRSGKRSFSTHFIFSFSSFFGVCAKKLHSCTNHTPKKQCAMENPSGPRSVNCVAS